MNVENIKDSKILIVDDNPTNLSVLCTYLESIGFMVAVVQDGKDALEYVGRIKPDIILLDIMMPGIDGFETCRRLKADDETKDIPILFMSALTEIIDKVKGFEVGGVDYITKPFRQEEILARVKAHLTIQKQQRELALLMEKEHKRKMAELRWNIMRFMPHELLTPLMIMKGFVSLLVDARSTMKEKEIAETLRSISNAVTRLERLVKNYIMYVQIEVTSNEPDKMAKLHETYTANAERVILFHARQKAEEAQRKVDLTVETGDSKSMIPISQDYFEKVLIEVIDNAFKFSEAGTPVHIEAVAMEHNFTIKISDNGRGMTPEDIENVGAYMQFERDHYEQQGSGLGLTLAKRLVELHNGEIRIESEPKKGTTVKIMLQNFVF